MLGNAGAMNECSLGGPGKSRCRRKGATMLILEAVEVCFHGRRKQHPETCTVTHIKKVFWRHRFSAGPLRGGTSCGQSNKTSESLCTPLQSTKAPPKVRGNSAQCYPGSWQRLPQNRGGTRIRHLQVSSQEMGRDGDSCLDSRWPQHWEAEVVNRSHIHPERLLWLLFLCPQVFWFKKGFAFTLTPPCPWAVLSACASGCSDCTLLDAGPFKTRCHPESYFAESRRDGLGSALHSVLPSFNFFKFHNVEIVGCSLAWICLHCYTKIPQTGWLINWNLFLMVLQAGNLRSTCQHDQVLVRPSSWLQIADFTWQRAEERKQAL